MKTEIVMSMYSEEVVEVSEGIHDQPSLELHINCGGRGGASVSLSPKDAERLIKALQKRIAKELKRKTR